MGISFDGKQEIFFFNYPVTHQGRNSNDYLLVVWQNPMFYTSRKNNSRWTAKEVERLVQGVSKFGVGRWTMLKQKFFKTSI